MNRFLRLGTFGAVVLSILFAGCAKDDGTEDFNNAKTAANGGDYAKAAELFRSAAGKCPTNFTARMALATTSLRLGEIDEANRALVSALALDPDSAEAFLIEGQIAYERKEYRRSVLNFDAIARETSLPKALRSNAFASRSVVKYVTGAFEESRVDALKALALDAKNAAAWYQMGVLSRDSRFFEAALIQFNMASRCLAENDGRASRIEKKILPDLRKQTEADAKATLGKTPVDPLAEANKLAGKAKKPAETDKAFAAYRIAMAAKPFSQKTYNDAVAFAKAKGRWATVVEFRLRSLMYLPGDKNSVNSLIEALQKTGRKKEIPMWKDYLSMI